MFVISLNQGHGFKERLTMFKIVDEDHEETLQRYLQDAKEQREQEHQDGINYNVHPDGYDQTGKEFWVKVTVTNIMGFDRLNHMVLHPEKIEGGEFLGFKITQIHGNLVDKEQMKKKMFEAIHML